MFLETKRIGEAPTTKPPESWRQLLLDGADLMERVGHCKYALVNQRGEVCFIGSIRFGSCRDVRDAHWAMTVALLQSPVDWNNAPGRTGAEVVAKMREVANAR